MTDPYKVLGIGYDADEKQIKLAYKELVKQNHPDRFQAEEEVKLATQRMTDINSAYDQIMDDRRRGVSPHSYERRGMNERRTQSGTGGFRRGGTAQQTSGAHFRRYKPEDYNYTPGGFGTGYAGVDYAQVRNIIAGGDLGTADGMLEKVPEKMRSADWYYLKGMICSKRGWLNDAYHNVRMATQMDPGNLEYQNTFSDMNRARSGYMTGNTSSGGKGSDCCEALCSAEGCECCCDMCMTSV